MKFRASVLLFVAGVVGASCGGITPPSLAASAEPAAAAAQDERDLPERDEITKSVELAAGARVEVSGINGSVTAETATGNVAEVYIVRSAKTREALQHRRVFVEATSSLLRIEGEEERGHTPDVRQRVVLKLPRNIEL